MNQPSQEDLVSAFADPPNVAVFTTKSVVSGAVPVLYVTHESEDGAWQFFSGNNVSNDEIQVVALRTILRVDATLVEIADLPIGWVATRATHREPWIKREQAASE